MKKLLLLASLIGPTFCANAQIAKGANSTVVSQYRKLKTDLEEKARAVKDMPEATLADVKDMELSYKTVQRSFHKFLGSLSSEARQAAREGNSLNTSELDRQHFKDLLTLYKQYTDNFLTRYEELTGLRSKPLAVGKIEQELAAKSGRTQKLSPQDMRQLASTDLRVEKWSAL